MGYNLPRDLYFSFGGGYGGTPYQESIIRERFEQFQRVLEIAQGLRIHIPGLDSTLRQFEQVHLGYRLCIYSLDYLLSFLTGIINRIVALFPINQSTIDIMTGFASIMENISVTIEKVSGSSNLCRAYLTFEIPYKYNSITTDYIGRYNFDDFCVHMNEFGSNCAQICSFISRQRSDIIYGVSHPGTITDRQGIRLSDDALIAFLNCAVLRYSDGSTKGTTQQERQELFNAILYRKSNDDTRMSDKVKHTCDLLKVELQTGYKSIHDVGVVRPIVSRPIPGLQELERRPESGPTTFTFSGPISSDSDSDLDSLSLNTFYSDTGKSHHQLTEGNLLEYLRELEINKYTRTAEENERQLESKIHDSREASLTMASQLASQMAPPVASQGNDNTSSQGDSHLNGWDNLYDANIFNLGQQILNDVDNDFDINERDKINHLLSVANRVDKNEEDLKELNKLRETLIYKRLQQILNDKSSKYSRTILRKRKKILGGKQKTRKHTKRPSYRTKKYKNRPVHKKITRRHKKRVLRKSKKCVRLK